MNADAIDKQTTINIATKSINGKLWEIKRDLSRRALPKISTLLDPRRAWEPETPEKLWKRSRNSLKSYEKQGESSLLVEEVTGPSE